MGTHDRKIKNLEKLFPKPVKSTKNDSGFHKNRIKKSNLEENRSRADLNPIALVQSHSREDWRFCRGSTLDEREIVDLSGSLHIGGKELSGRQLCPKIGKNFQGATDLQTMKLRKKLEM